MELLMLIGTQTGNTELVAEEIAQQLAQSGHRIHFVDMADAYPEMLSDYAHLIVATSTWGDGELPDNAIEFYETLDNLSPDLSHIQYGILALGDHVYDPHYCQAARIMTGILDNLGAQKRIETFEIDAGPTFDDIQAATNWAERFTQLV